MIFKTVNHFPKLNSSFLHACLIFDCQNLAIVNRWNPTGAGVRQHPVASILPTPDSGHQPPDSGRNIAEFRPRRPDLAKMARIRPALAGSGHNGRDPAGSRRIRPLIRPDLAKTAGSYHWSGRIQKIPAGIRPDMTWFGRIQKFSAGTRPFRSDPVILSRRSPAIATGRCRILAAFAKL